MSRPTGQCNIATSINFEGVFMKDLLDALREFDAVRTSDDLQMPDQVITRTLPAIPPVLDDTGVLQRLDPRIQNALSATGINRLYEHQAKAISAALQGRDVVLEAPTASGKTVSFLAPMLELLLRDPTSHALMIHPMKALSNDQRRQLNELEAEIKNPGRALDSWPFDGDTDKEYRKILKGRPPAILLTNPEMLHQSFLGWSTQWEHFLSNLKFLVIDEIHEYRGYFGTNFALLLRRFFKKLDELGARPQVFLASATCANPEEHAFRLTGRECVPVRSVSGMRPERRYVFVDPAGIPDYCFLDVFEVRIANAALACLSRELTTIVFCPSRNFAERVTHL